MFKLTEEQIEEILNEYGSSKQFIKIVEQVLNEIDIIQDFDDYYEVVASIAAQKQTIEVKKDEYKRKEDKIRVSMSAETIIINELNRKYDNFEDSSPIIKQKILNYERRK